MGALFLVLGMAVAAGISVHAQATPQFNYSVPTVRPKKLNVVNVNAKATTTIYYQNDLSGAYITKIWDGTAYCYIYNGTAMSCIK